MSDALNTDLKEKGVQINPLQFTDVSSQLVEKPEDQLKTAFNQNNEKKRYQWAKKYKDWTKEQWRKVVLSDESQFFVQCQRSQHGRRSSEEKLRHSHMNQFIKNTEKKMLWECCSYCGIGSLQPFERMLRSSQFIEVLRRRVFQSWKRGIVVVLASTNRAGSSPCHASKMVKKFMTEKNVPITWLAREFSRRELN